MLIVLEGIRVQVNHDCIQPNTEAVFVKGSQGKIIAFAATVLRDGGAQIVVDKTSQGGEYAIYGKDRQVFEQVIQAPKVQELLEAISLKSNLTHISEPTRRLAQGLKTAEKARMFHRISQHADNKGNNELSQQASRLHHHFSQVAKGILTRSGEQSQSVEEQLRGFIQGEWTRIQQQQNNFTSKYYLENL